MKNKFILIIIATGLFAFFSSCSAKRQPVSKNNDYAINVTLINKTAKEIIATKLKLNGVSVSVGCMSPGSRATSMYVRYNKLGNGFIVYKEIPSDPLTEIPVTISESQLDEINRGQVKEMVVTIINFKETKTEMAR